MQRHDHNFNDNFHHYYDNNNNNDHHNDDYHDNHNRVPVPLHRVRLCEW